MHKLNVEPSKKIEVHELISTSVKQLSFCSTSCWLKSSLLTRLIIRANSHRMYYTSFMRSVSCIFSIMKRLIFSSCAFSSEFSLNWFYFFNLLFPAICNISLKPQFFITNLNSVNISDCTSSNLNSVNSFCISAIAFSFSWSKAFKTVDSDSSTSKFSAFSFHSKPINNIDTILNSKKQLSKQPN